MTSRRYHSGPPRYIVMCGSMGALPVMERLAKQCEGEGISVILPDVDDGWEGLSQEQVSKAKKKASLRHMRRILRQKCWGILVVNTDRYGQHNYIGPNVLAEIAVAFACRKQIYLYQEIPNVLYEELTAWEARPLQCDLSPLVSNYVGSLPPRQPQLFEPVIA